jgi:hypothetical protein
VRVSVRAFLGVTTSTSTPSVPTIDPRAELLVRSLPNTPMGGRLQLLFCFQGLSLPKGMLLTRGLTRTEAARRINDFFGCKAVTRASKPPRPASGAGALEQYLTWALAEAERRNPGLVLEVVPV